jgi:hypothetical protein
MLWRSRIVLCWQAKVCLSSESNKLFNLLGGAEANYFLSGCCLRAATNFFTKADYSKFACDVAKLLRLGSEDVIVASTADSQTDSFYGLNVTFMVYATKKLCDKKRLGAKACSAGRDSPLVSAMKVGLYPNSSKPAYEIV